MFIIERRAGELIQVGEEIQLCVLDTDGETVRIGVIAPRDVPVSALKAVEETPPLVEQGDKLVETSFHGSDASQSKPG